jgi:hypothetical protein
MDKVQKPRNSVCYSPSSQRFRNYVDHVQKLPINIISVSEYGHHANNRELRSETELCLMLMTTERIILPFIVWSSGLQKHAGGYKWSGGGRCLHLEQNTRCHNLEDRNINIGRHENLNSNIVILLTLGIQYWRSSFKQYIIKNEKFGVVRLCWICAISQWSNPRPLPHDQS